MGHPVQLLANHQNIDWPFILVDWCVLGRQPGLLRAEDLEQESPHQRLGGETDPALEDRPLRQLRQETV